MRTYEIYVGTIEGIVPRGCGGHWLLTLYTININTHPSSKARGPVLAVDPDEDLRDGAHEACSEVWQLLRDSGLIEPGAWMPTLSISEAIRFGSLTEPANENGLRVSSDAHRVGGALEGWEAELLAATATELVVHLVEELNDAA